MLARYVQVTGDRDILRRGLPLAEVSSIDPRVQGHALIHFTLQKELRWWSRERSLPVQSPFTNQTHTVYTYAVNNSAPRPESYRTGTFLDNFVHFKGIYKAIDYETANSPDLPSLNDTQKADLYAELASGAESGWDYSARWFSTNGTSLRDLQVRSKVAVDLNSILCTFARRAFRDARSLLLLPFRSKPH
jgi:alpha,alpha-trehalase